MSRPAKICVVCGREFQWRRKWRDDWQRVRTCSRACRKAGLSDVDVRLEETILRLLGSRSKNASICPGEAARELAAGKDIRNWRPLMEPARRAARRLAHQGKIVILQGGKQVDPSRFKGPVRLQQSKTRDAFE